MSTQGQFNAKSPTIKRILKEATELSTSPPSHIHAAPLEANIFEWHFTIRGPPAPSAFAEGIYHGRIVLPPTYPLRPPSFRFLTPSGRFEVNREICLSISGHHEESWQPAWGIRTALVAIRSFMDTEVKGQLGGVEASEFIRRKLAGESRNWKCQMCKGGSNGEIMATADAEAKLARLDADGSSSAQTEEEQVPDELRIGYKDEMTADAAAQASSPSSSSSSQKDGPTPRPPNSQQHTIPEESGQLRQRVVARPAPALTPTPTQQQLQQQPQAQTESSQTTTTTTRPAAALADIAQSSQTAAASSPPETHNAPTATITTATIRPARGTARTDSKWIDFAIVGVSAVLALMVIRKLIGLFMWS